MAIYKGVTDYQT